MTKILKKIFTSFVILSFLNSITFAQSISNNALPTNPTISSGSANISQTTNKLTVNQNTDKLITNWSSFNIGKDATVQFVQPSSTSSALNRVTSSDPSYIFGTLQANGKIILVNPNGVLFANGAKVDVGSIIASTLKTADKDFLSDQLIFEKDNLAGTIQNDGTIRAFAGGTVALIGSQVTNNGKIKTKQGTTALLAGDKVTLTLNGNRLIKYNIDEGTLNSLVENNNAIIAKEGIVILSAKALNLLSKSSVNNTGNIEAKGFSQVGGKIYLDGDQTTNSGKLVASSKNNSGGLIQVTGEEVKLTSTASLDASGATGGGTILVGGSFQNSDPTVRQSRKTIIEGGSILNASAKKDGDGGTIVAWSDINNPNSVTSAQGTFLATGGLNSGNGGNIETSGHYLSTDSISVNASGLNKSGTWLLDPYNVTIGSSNAGTAYSSNFTPSATSTITASSIQTSLNSGTSVTITTGSSGSDSGDITISNSNPISKTSGGNATLTLQAARNITIGTSSAITSTSGTLGITLSSAHTSGATTGGVKIDSNLTSNGGDILVGGNQGTAVNGIGYAENYAGGSSNQTSSAIQINAVTISSGAGKIVLNGENKISSGGNIDVNNPSGVYIAPNSNITSTTGNIYSTTKSSGDKNFSLAFDQVSGSLTTVNSSGGGAIRLDATNSSTSTVAMGLTNYGQRSTIKFSSLPTVAGLFILINGSVQPVTYTTESNSACTVSITNCGYVTVAGSNNSYQNAIYGSSTAATKATYVNVGSGTKVYDGLTTASGFTSSSFTADSTITWPTGFTNSYISSNYIFKTSSKDVGSYSFLTDYMSNGTTTPATFTDSSNNVYAIGWTYTNPYTITAKSLTTTLTGTASKEYNANTTATLSGSNYSVATGVSGETISVTKTTGTYNNKNVGTSKTVTATLASGDYSISGTGGLLSNYTLTTGDITGGIGTITAKTVGLSASKTYDGSTSLTDYVTLTTGITGEALTYTGATSNNSHVATTSKYISAITLADGTGGLASNYQLPTLNNSNAPVTITAKTLTPTITNTGVTKEYDGTTASSITPTYSFSGLVSGDTGATLTNTSKLYNSAHVASASSLTVSGLSISGITGSNSSLISDYSLDSTSKNVSATITAATLTPTISNSSVTKVYDGSTTSTFTPTYTFSGLVSGDTDATLTNTSKTYNSKDVASANTVTVSGLSISGITGNKSSATTDYTLDNTSKTKAATITAKALTASISGSSSTYGSSVTSGTLTLDGIIGSDSVSGSAVSIVSPSYSTSNNLKAGTYKQSVTSTLSGTDAGNYSLTGGFTTGTNNYTVNAKPLNVSGLTADNKVYDGTTDATITGTASFSGTVGTDVLSVNSLSVTGTFADKNVGNSKAINLSGVTLTGTDSNNYTVSGVAGVSANITAKALTASAAATNKTYDGTTTATTTLTLSGLIGTETLGQTVASTFSDKNAGTGKTVTVNSIDLADGSNGGLASNYSISAGQTTTANINAKGLTISGITASDKNYDGTTTATVSTSGVVYSGKVSGDSVTVSATGTFQSASAGRGKTVNLTSTYSGTDVSNYNITGQSTTTANINSVGDSDNSNSSNSNSSNSNSNSSKSRCALIDCNKDKLINGEIVIVRKNTFTSDNVKVTPVSIKPEVETRKDQAAPSLIKIIILKPGQEPKVDKEYEVSIRGNDAILKEQTDIIDKTITNPGKSIGSARFSIENDKGKILEYNMVVRESGLEIRPLSFDALLFADKNKATVAGAAMIDVANNLKLPVDGIKTILFDLIIDKVFEDAMFNQKDSNRNIFNINYY